MVRIAKEKQEETVKKIFKEKITCPYCEKRIIVTKTKEVTAAAIPAVFTESVFAEKDSQTKLTDAEKKAGVKKK